MTTEETISLNIWAFVSKICPHIRLYVNPQIRFSKNQILRQKFVHRQVI